MICANAVDNIDPHNANADLLLSTRKFSLLNEKCFITYKIELQLTQRRVKV